MTPRWHVLFALVAALACGTVAAQGVKLRPGPVVSMDGKGGGLSGPEGVACGGGTLAVADTGHGRVIVYEVTDRLVTPKSEFQPAEIPYPVRIHLDTKGGLLIQDGRSRKIGRFGLDGAFAGFVPVDAVPAPIVRSFDVGPNGEIFALDIAGRRVLVIARSGEVARQIALPAECRSPSDLAVGASGRVFVIDAAGAQLYAAAEGQQSAAPLGKSLREDLDFATSLTVDAEGRILVLDRNGGGIVAVGSDGSFRGRQAGFGWTEGRLRWPAAICADESGRVAVADRENNRVTTFVLAP